MQNAGMYLSILPFQPIVCVQSLDKAPLCYPRWLFFRHTLPSSVDILLTMLFLPPGEYDHLPEVAFYMVGDISEAVAKAERLAEEVQ